MDVIGVMARHPPGGELYSDGMMLHKQDILLKTVLRGPWQFVICNDVVMSAPSVVLCG